MKKVAKWQHMQHEVTAQMQKEAKKVKSFDKDNGESEL